MLTTCFDYCIPNRCYFRRLKGFGAEVIATADRRSTQGTFNAVGVNWYGWVVEKYSETFPELIRVTMSLTKRASRQGVLTTQEDAYIFDDWFCKSLPCFEYFIGWLSFDLFLDCEEQLNLVEYEC